MFSQQSISNKTASVWRLLLEQKAQLLQAHRQVLGRQIAEEDEERFWCSTFFTDQVVDEKGFDRAKSTNKLTPEEGPAKFQGKVWKWFDGLGGFFSSRSSFGLVAGFKMPQSALQQETVCK